MCFVNSPHVACQAAFELVYPSAFVTAMTIFLLWTWHVATNAAGRPSRLRLISRMLSAWYWMPMLQAWVTRLHGHLGWK
jgi:hypothetical protein